MNELKGKQRNSQESLIYFHKANLHTAFSFRKPQALTQTWDYLIGEGRFQQFPYFYITMGVRWLLIRGSGGGCALSIRLGVFSPLLRLAGGGGSECMRLASTFIDGRSLQA